MNYHSTISIASDIGAALGGQPSTRGWLVRCPAHDDHRASCSLRDGPYGLRAHCFAGCTEQEILAALISRGLLDEEGATRPADPEELRRQREEAKQQAEWRSRAARRIWAATEPIRGTPAERYLRHRGIRLPLPPTLRFLRQSVWTWNGPRMRMADLQWMFGDPLYQDQFWTVYPPALVAAIHDPAGDVVAVHVISVTWDGFKATRPGGAKVTYGPMGDGAIQLAAPTHEIGLAEGIENALAAMQLYGVPVWAAGGAGRLHRMWVPGSVRNVYLFGDDDEAGEKALNEATAHHRRAGRFVEALLPARGKDFNDLLVAGRRA